MGSFATITPSLINISPCRLTFNSTDLGAVEGDVTVTAEMPISEIKVAQLGASIVDMVSNGVNFRIKAKMLELSPTQLKKLFPPAHLIGSTGLFANNNIGLKYSTLAAQLVLHPLNKDNSDKANDILFYKAVAMSNTEMVFGNETMTGFDLEFIALPDTTTTPARFAFFGDPAIGLIAASAGAAVAGGGNVGNGTVSSISVFDAFTKTETITLTCIDEGTNSGEFRVTGTVAPIQLGIATVGTPFTADDGRIQFTINDGATDFAEGDTFTIATVAANYI